jgi:hypothetical protein
MVTYTNDNKLQWNMDNLEIIGNTIFSPSEQLEVNFLSFPPNK